MIALIPARGGSKGLPGKNILELQGKPLIAHTIEAALGASCVDRVLVTTDSKEIADAAKAYGAKVPFMRPDELATDTAGAVDVYLHAIEWTREHWDNREDTFMVLLPTTPLRTSADIDGAYRAFAEKKAKTLIAVKEAPVPPGWYLSAAPDGKVSPCGFGSDLLMSNRQKAERYVVPCGAIYILSYELLRTKRTYYCEDTIGYLLPEERAVDIDRREDFEYARYLMERNG